LETARSLQVETQRDQPRPAQNLTEHTTTAKPRLAEISRDQLRRAETSQKVMHTHRHRGSGTGRDHPKRDQPGAANKFRTQTHSVRGAARPAKPIQNHSKRISSSKSIRDLPKTVQRDIDAVGPADTSQTQTKGSAAPHIFES
jgi:hypothetical protein